LEQFLKNPPQRTYVDSSEIHNHHWEVLHKRPLETSARSAAATLSDGIFTLSLLGRDLLIDSKKRLFSWADGRGDNVSFQEALAAISYLANAIETEPAGEWISFREIPGGEGFFRGPHAIATKSIERRFGENPRGLAEAALKLGGKEEEGGDSSVSLFALPRVPFLIVLWGGDDEEPARATMLTDRRIHLHMPLDVIWALTNITISNLIRGG